MSEGDTSNVMLTYSKTICSENHSHNASMFIDILHDTVSVLATVITMTVMKMLQIVEIQYYITDKLIFQMMTYYKCIFKTSQGRSSDNIILSSYIFL